MAGFGYNGGVRLKFINCFINMYYLNELKSSSSTILEQVVAGTVAGIAAAALIKILNWLTSPKLKMYFKDSDTYTIAPVQNGVNFLFMHLVVKNVKRKMAVGCKVFLLKLEQKKNEKFEEIPLKAHLTLKWANENETIGYNGLEIPGNYRRRIDLAQAPLNSSSNFYFFIEGGARGIRNGFPEGEYRLTLQATGENTSTVTKRFIFKWHDKFIKENIIVEEENFFYRLIFSFKNIVNF